MLIVESILKRIFYFCIITLLLNGCAPLVPDNYLRPTNVLTSEKINGEWKTPRFIPITPKILGSAEGRALLKSTFEPQPYRIGAYDNLNVIVWGHSELSTVSIAAMPMPGNINMSGLNPTVMSGATNNPAVLVQSDGTIFYPFVGYLHVAGLTVKEAQEKIAERLSKYIRHPQVSVQIAKFRNRNIYVLGEVKLSGIQPITDKPLTLMEALSNAGGINTTSADPTHIYIIRGPFDQPDVYWINAQTPQALIISEQFPLQENDIVYVSAATFNSWNSFIQTVLPSFTTYYTIKGLTR